MKLYIVPCLVAVKTFSEEDAISRASCRQSNAATFNHALLLLDEKLPTVEMSESSFIASEIPHSLLAIDQYKDFFIKKN